MAMAMFTSVLSLLFALFVIGLWIYIFVLIIKLLRYGIQLLRVTIALVDKKLEE